jgi:predicted DCC family thiol-disulfide oxidoreductase YuxK
MTQPHAIIVFDGVCNFCNGSINLVMRNDPADTFRFAANQSAAGQALLAKHGIRADAVETVYLIEGETVYNQSTAALRIARKLRNPWPLLYACIVIPRPLRDGVYAWVATNRYRWFGKKEACRIPTPAERAKFLA